MYLDAMNCFSNLADAFWDMVSEGPMGKITIAGLCRRANVSHNTFYYHFECVEDLSARLLAENNLPELAAAIACGGKFPADGAAPTNEGALLRFSRFCDVARNGSPQLIAQMRRMLERTWLDAAGTTRKNLDGVDSAQLAFVSGGIVAAMASAPAKAPSSYVQALFSSDAGAFVRGFLSSLSAGYTTCPTSSSSRTTSPS